MYAYIKGKIKHFNSNSVIIENNGIGYEIFTDAFSLSEMVLEDDATLYTYFSVKEDSQTLYGFSKSNQKEMFVKFISINGIGPKAALSILSVIKVEDIVSSAISGNYSAFESVPGIGKKTAQRIVLELKGKVDDMGIISDTYESSDNPNIIEDAASALIGLGFQRGEALEVLSAVKNLGDTAEDLVMLALKRIGR